LCISVVPLAAIPAMINAAPALKSEAYTGAPSETFYSLKNC